ncbi:hypothetical protein BpHYR1_027332 [Brachionus plicatilis]|uniref:Uncharacterized protein n=1 Tax=Brachionus plicatilis TaxID=10195 RepID=A0A3M7SYG1_BRAPC|nr:hypothetical protein BpHYR1_027332 [Brachionus plicatilis]
MIVRLVTKSLTVTLLVFSLGELWIILGSSQYPLFVYSVAEFISTEEISFSNDVQDNLISSWESVVKCDDIMVTFIRITRMYLYISYCLKRHDQSNFYSNC